MDRTRVVVVSLDGNVLDLVSAVAGLEVIGFLDANKDAYDPAIPNLGTDDSWAALKSREPGLKVVLAADPTRLRERLSQVYGDSALLTVVSPDARVSATAEIGHGSIVQTGALIGRYVRLGRACKINCDAVLNHDVSIGDYSTVAPGAVILGTAKVGRGCYIGAGATILQRRSVGDGATVGAGAVVTHDVPPGQTVVGAPARPLPAAKTK